MEDRVVVVGILGCVCKMDPILNEIRCESSVYKDTGNAKTVKVSE